MLTIAILFNTILNTSQSKQKKERQGLIIRKKKTLLSEIVITFWVTGFISRKRKNKRKENQQKNKEKQ